MALAIRANAQHVGDFYFSVVDKEIYSTDVQVKNWDWRKIFDRAPWTAKDYKNFKTYQRKCWNRLKGIYAFRRRDKREKRRKAIRELFQKQ